eukprot:7359279-Ditylum_brightwellii.AAC.1
MNDLYVMEVLDVAVAWDSVTPAPQNPNEVVNIFKSQGITRAQVEVHNDLVWATIAHGGAANETPNYFKMFGVFPTDM